ATRKKLRYFEIIKKLRLSHFFLFLISVVFNLTILNLRLGYCSKWAIFWACKILIILFMKYIFFDILLKLLAQRGPKSHEYLIAINSCPLNVKIVLFLQIF